MRIAINTLKEIWPDAHYFNVSDFDVFDYFDVAKIDHKAEKNSNCLYFVIYETTPEVEGWYIDRIDRRINLPTIIENKQSWTFVIDSSSLSIVGNVYDCKYIVVNNVYEAVKKLYLFKLNAIRPRIIAITGSAGKTTTGVLIESVLNVRYKCLRIFSKRITPYILFANILNRLDFDCEFVVAEMGLYRIDHPQKLAQLLPPDYAIILNILGMHIGVNNIKSLDDISKSKKGIIQEKSVAVLNYDDPMQEKYLARVIYWISVERKDAHVYLEKNFSDKIILNVFGEKVTVFPYVYTKLYVYQCLIASCVGRLVGVSTKGIEEAINNFEPQENRLNRFLYRGFTVFLSALITHEAYLRQMSDNFYEDTTLIILKISFGEDNFESILPNLPLAFERFSRVIILSSKSNLEILAKVNLPSNTKFTLKDELFFGIPEGSIIFLHYGKFFAEHRIDSISIENIINLAI